MSAGVGGDRVSVAAVRIPERGRVLEGLVQTLSYSGDVTRQLVVRALLRFRPCAGEADELDAVLGAIALEQSGNVDLDALLRDTELRGDVLVRLPARDAAQDDVLPRSEWPLDRHRTKVYGLSVITHAGDAWYWPNRHLRLRVVMAHTDGYGDGGRPKLVSVGGFRAYGKQ